MICGALETVLNMRKKKTTVRTLAKTALDNGRDKCNGRRFELLGMGPSVNSSVEQTPNYRVQIEERHFIVRMAGLTAASVVNIYRLLLNTDGSCCMYLASVDDSEERGIASSPVQFSTGIFDFKHRDFEKVFDLVNDICDFVSKHPVQKWRVVTIRAASDDENAQVTEVEIETA